MEVKLTENLRKKESTTGEKLSSNKESASSKITVRTLESLKTLASHKAVIAFADVISMSITSSGGLFTFELMLPPCKIFT